MNFKKLLPLAVSVAALTTLSSVYAGGYDNYQPPVDYNAPGAYIEGNVGFIHVGIDGIYADGGFGANANLGYKFMRNAAVEAGYTYYNASDDNRAAGDPTSLHDIHAAVKGILPFGNEDRMNVFVKAGVSRLSTSGGDKNDSVGGSATAFFGGGGFGYHLSTNVEFNIQYQGNFRNGVSIGLVSAGIGYNFG